MKLNLFSAFRTFYRERAGILYCTRSLIIEWVVSILLIFPVSVASIASNSNKTPVNPIIAGNGVLPLLSFMANDDLIVANAGPDQDLCNETITQLVGNDPFPGTGSWSFVSGPNTPVIAPLNQTSATVSGMIPGTIPYIFEYTITNGNSSSSDLVTVTTYEPTSTSFAGFDQNLCSELPATIFMAANSPTSGIGQWTQIFGPGTANFVDPTDPSSMVSGLVEGFYLFDWTISNCVCSPSSSAVFIQITQPAIVFAGNDTTFCDLPGSISLISATADHYSSLLWSTSGTGTFDNPTAIQPTYVPSSSDISVGSVLLTLTATGNSPCQEVSDGILLTFSGPVSAFAGPDETIAPSPGTFLLDESTASINSSLQWTTSGTGSFNDANLLHPVYTPSSMDIATGNVTLALLATNFTGCADASDAMILSFSPETQSNAGPDGETCQGNSFTISGSSASNYSNLSWSHNGAGTLSASNTLNPTYIPSVNETGAVTLTMAAYPVQVASDPILDEMVLVIRPLPTVVISGGATLCEGDSSMLRIDLTGSAPWKVTYTNGSTSSTLADIASSPVFLSVVNPAGIYNYQVTSLTDIHCVSTPEQLQGSAIVTVNPAPVADFTYKADCGSHLISFLDASSTIGNSSIKDWSWDFGVNGTLSDTSTFRHPLFNYTAEGSYLVTLTATTEAGCSNTISKQLGINNLPQASFSWAGNQFGLSVDFKSTSIIASAEIAEYSWDFGDGSSQTFLPPIQTASHIYAEAGYYVVTLTITDKNGCTNTTSTQILVCPMPQIVIEIQDTLICQNLPVTILNLTNGAIDQWTWNWGDGSAPIVEKVFNPSITHTYSLPGKFVISLSIIRNLGDSPITDAIEREITVQPSPVAGFITEKQCLGDKTLFQNTIDSIENPGLRFSWNFGDPATTGDISSSHNPLYTYTSAGTFTAKQTVINPFGCQDTISRQVGIHSLPTAEFAMSTACLGNPTQFTNLKGETEAPLVHWVWKINNGDHEILANEEAPYYTFENPGSYPVMLSVIDANGCSNSGKRTITIEPSPISAFNIEDHVGYEQGKVRFNNGSLNAAVYLWDFGNGETSSEESPLIRFTQDGTYHIRLMAKNTNGCSDSISFDYSLLFKGLYVPNAFAPDGQAESVRLWKPAGVNLATYQVEIFDKWNHRLWYSDKLDETGSPLESWDGTDNGNPCQDGVYFWKISASYVDGTPWQNLDIGNHQDMRRQNSGTLTLFR